MVSADVKKAVQLNTVIKYTGIEGLDVGFAEGDNESAAAVVENTVMYAKYAIDAFTIGIKTTQLTQKQQMAFF